MSEITRGVMGMPYEMTMDSELSRRQFYAIAREVYAENESLRKDAARYQWIRDVICIDHLHDTVIAADNAEEYDFCIDQDMTRD